MIFPIKIAVLISGTGRTFENIHKNCKDVVTVISSKRDCLGVEKAKVLGYNVKIISKKSCSGSFILQSSEIFDVCREERIDLVCLAGWLDFLSIPADYTNKVMNIHPSLLPAFGGKGMYGIHVHEKVLEYGCKWSGCTVHFANDQYDAGAVISQSAVRVYHDDTPENLAERVFQQELMLYPLCINAFAEGRIRIDGRKVTVG